MRSHECLVHVDFSERYNCKYRSEIQLMQFGASKNQATQHTGVYNVGANAEPVSFCIIFPSKQHDPPAIWAHLHLIFKEIREKFPNVTRLHVFSDGPATQYKQKGNFYMFATQIFQYGFTAGTSNFHEASHGKGTPDGVGGALKRSADRMVRQGKDLEDSLAVMKALEQTGTNIHLHCVDNQSIENNNTAMPPTSKLVTVRGTMRLHQIVCTKTEFISY